MERELRIVRQQVKNMKIDLSGLNIITECASGPYMFNTLTPLLANANQVVAIGKDSHFGLFKDIRSELLALCDSAEINTDRLILSETLEDEYISKADIITNSNILRPINKETISKLKPTTVLPLMWETWEFRDDCLDIKAAIENDILVLGTDESHPSLNFHPYAGMLGLNLLFKLGLECHRSNIILMGGSFIGSEIAKTLSINNIPYSWFVEKPSNGKQIAYEKMKHQESTFKEADAIIVCELESWSPLFTDSNGWISFNELAALNPSIKIGVITGNINQDALDKSGLAYLPEKIMPPGQISYQAYEMGPRPILELFAAGLKVGEVMARCRAKGMGLEETIEHSLKHSAAMDFPNGGYFGMKNGNNSFTNKEHHE
jgi:hypothetical protein